jgi:transposase-like protein
MAHTQDSRKELRWLGLIQRWQRSNLTVREFCLRHHLREPSFYFWRRVLRERGLIHDRPEHSDQEATPAFVKVALASEPKSATAVELVLSDRRVLRVRPGFDADTLLELVRLLEAPPC